MCNSVSVVYVCDQSEQVPRCRCYTVVANVSINLCYMLAQIDYLYSNSTDSRSCVLQQRQN